MSDALPADSGSKNNQESQDQQPTDGDEKPQLQLAVIARGVTLEAAGLVQYDSEALSNLASHRLLAAHMREQEARIGESRGDLADAAERERNLREQIACLRERVARSLQALADERKLRTPRAVISGVGALLLGVGGEQYAAQHELGIALSVAGLAVVVFVSLFGSSTRP